MRRRTNNNTNRHRRRPAATTTLICFSLLTLFLLGRTCESKPLSPSSSRVARTASAAAAASTGRKRTSTAFLVDSKRKGVLSMSTTEERTAILSKEKDIEEPDPTPPTSPTTTSLTSSRGGTSNNPLMSSDSIKLLIGAGGIYSAFLYYGSLQEDVFRYTSSDGSKFTDAWFLQVLEALANVIVGFVGMQVMGPTKNIPLRWFGISGASQVTAKACTSLALANGLSFPVATLAKSGKMAPVMAGSLLLGGASYTTREYFQVAMIVGGTAVVSMGKKKGGSSTSTTLGVGYIILSLVLDGVTAGFQKRLKKETADAGVKPKSYDFMFWTNLFMCGTALVVALGLGEVNSGIGFCMREPEILAAIVKFSICSAIGQSFIFYTISNFDPLVLSTVTTTRKIFSVLLSIFLKGHTLSGIGWTGIMMACGGIVSELQSKASSKKVKV